MYGTPLTRTTLFCSSVEPRCLVSYLVGSDHPFLVPSLSTVPALTTVRITSVSSQ